MGGEVPNENPGEMVEPRRDPANEKVKVRRRAAAIAYEKAAYEVGEGAASIAAKQAAAAQAVQGAVSAAEAQALANRASAVKAASASLGLGTLLAVTGAVVLVKSTQWYRVCPVFRPLCPSAHYFHALAQRAVPRCNSHNTRREDRASTLLLTPPCASCGSVGVETTHEFAEAMRGMLPSRARGVSETIKLTEKKEGVTGWFQSSSMGKFLKEQVWPLASPLCSVL